MTGLALLPLRIVLGIIFIYHGYPKVFGEPNPRFAEFLESKGFIPGSFWAPVSGLTEFVGGICLLVGFLTRLSALALAINMFFAIRLSHWENGFSNRNRGYEFPLSLLGGALTILLAGAGPVSVDRDILHLPIL